MPHAEAEESCKVDSVLNRRRVIDSSEWSCWFERAETWLIPKQESVAGLPRVGSVGRLPTGGSVGGL